MMKFFSKSGKISLKMSSEFNARLVIGRENHRASMIGSWVILVTMGKSCLIILNFRVIHKSRALTFKIGFSTRQYNINCLSLLKRSDV